MGKEDSLCIRINEVLHYMWDPIGVSSDPEARDEYDEYSRQVYSMCRHGATKEDVAAYLVKVSENCMELTSSSELCEKVAETILDWVEYLNCD